MKIKDEHKEKLFQFIRFASVGAICTALHYAIYYVLQKFVSPTPAYTAGYALSFICNYFLTTFFTFKSKTSAGNALGFAGCHAVNYLISIGLLNLFIYLGIDKLIAPILVLAIAIPVNFILLRTLFVTLNRKKGKRE